MREAFWSQIQRESFQHFSIKVCYFPSVFCTYSSFSRLSEFSLILRLLIFSVNMNSFSVTSISCSEVYAYIYIYMRLAYNAPFLIMSLLIFGSSFSQCVKVVRTCLMSISWAVLWNTAQLFHSVFGKSRKSGVFFVGTCF